MMLTNEQLRKIIEKHNTWRETVGSKLDEKMDHKRQVSKEMRQLIEEVGLLAGGVFGPDQLCKSIEIQKKVHNLSSMSLPKFLGYFNYSRYFKNFKGSQDDFKKEHPEIGLGHPGVDLGEFSKALGALLVSKDDDFADAMERIWSFEGVGLAISAGYLYLWNPDK